MHEKYEKCDYFENAKFNFITLDQRKGWYNNEYDIVYD
jgi:hypothetical protein